MIKNTYYYVQQGTEPCHNLAMERFLLEHGPKNSCVLYLWQNAHTVVIGKNQNCWQECRLGQLEADGGIMVRRLSGGGAVYHDLGNLNFTFLTDKTHYDVSRQLDVILQALLKLGIKADKSGRNDLTIDGRKFSGNAFYESGNRCYHHGTLMVAVDQEKLGKYLQVSASKLAAKGVRSVQSRVMNLTEKKPDLTLEELKQALISAMQDVYGVKAEAYPKEWLDMAQIAEYEKEFRSDAWRFGQRLPFTWETEHRFSWGNIQLQIVAEYGKIKQAKIYSDAMDTDIIDAMANALNGCPFSGKAMADQLAMLGDRTEIYDVCQYFISLQL